ncbi:ADP-ribosylation factor 1 [Linnemannia elongata]|nr:ADP-ribosylation factor 1 [Linnemannia elongata]
MGAATSLPNLLSQQQSHDATSPPYYIMMGLSGAGKTAILDRLKIGLYIAHHPSISENIETIDYMSKRGQRVFNLWDITERGDRGLRVYESWRTLSQQYPQGIIFVVDSTDHSHLSMELAAERLSTVLREGVEDLTLLPLLVLANKQDSRYAMTVADVKDMLGLEELPQEQVWHIQGVSAKWGEGLMEGFDWLLEHSDLGVVRE